MSPKWFTLLLACCTTQLVFPNNTRATPASRVPDMRPAAVLDSSEWKFLEELEHASFRFFDEQVDINTGLVCDRGPADGGPARGKASIASSGFALSAWVVATEHGWVSRETAIVRVRQMLAFLADKAPVKNGFYYHFMELGTGERAWKCEVSTIDTSLFLAGAIVAREYFNDPEITNLVNRIYGRIDWPWFLNNGDTLALSWDDENGFSRYRWRSYSEHMVMSILGMGSPSKPLSADYWKKWERDVSTYGGQTYIHGAPPLFIHQFSHAYIDFRDRRDAYADYYHNSLLATLAQRKFCIDMRSVFPTWGERLWGITASDSEKGYIAWGGPMPTYEGSNLDGTIVPCAAGGSLPFAPSEALTTLQHMRETYSQRVWKRYGFVDAFNPESKWTSPDVIGIDVGITLLQAENARTGLIWALFMQAPEVKRALSLAGFASTERNIPESGRMTLRKVAADTWAAIARDPVTPNALGLRITATISAHALGLISSEEALKRLSDLVKNSPLPKDDAGLAQYAAALVTLRQAFPKLEPDATQHLNAINWALVVPKSDQLGSASRLAVFFKAATSENDASAQVLTANFTREVTNFGSVRVLLPANEYDQFVVGLWADERQLVTGASASQLAYARVMARRMGAETGPLLPIVAAAQVEYFPMEVLPDIESVNLTNDLAEPASTPAEATLAQAPANSAEAGRAALLVSLSNVLASNCIRSWFAQDPLIKQGVGHVPGFTQPAFGWNSSVFSHRELSLQDKQYRLRTASVRPATATADAWDWQTVAGLEYKDSVADVYPSDPKLELRFAFAWDENALYFKAVAMDTPPGYVRPEHRHEMVELFINPKGDGFQWHGDKDRQYTFVKDGNTLGFTSDSKAKIEIKTTPTGYTVSAAIPWSEIGVTPVVGMRLGATAAIYAGGPAAHSPALKLNWSYHPLEDGRAQLGVITLEKSEKETPAARDNTK